MKHGVIDGDDDDNNYVINNFDDKHFKNLLIYTLLFLLDSTVIFFKQSKESSVSVTFSSYIIFENYDMTYFFLFINLSDKTQLLLNTKNLKNKI